MKPYIYTSVRHLNILGFLSQGISVGVVQITDVDPNYTFEEGNLFSRVEDEHIHDPIDGRVLKSKATKQCC